MWRIFWCIHRSRHRNLFDNFLFDSSGNDKKWKNMPFVLEYKNDIWKSLGNRSQYRRVSSNTASHPPHRYLWHFSTSVTANGVLDWKLWLGEFAVKCYLYRWERIIWNSFDNIWTVVQANSSVQNMWILPLDFRCKISWWWLVAHVTTIEEFLRKMLSFLALVSAGQKWSTVTT